MILGSKYEKGCLNRDIESEERDQKGNDLQDGRK
jgi:hypothetical protein